MQGLHIYVFFAVDSKLRSKGYGSKILSLLKDRYKDKQIVLDLERTDEDGCNMEQRISRKDFYLHNGFNETGFVLSYSGMTFEVLFYGEKFDKQSYVDLFEIVRDTTVNPSILDKQQIPVYRDRYIPYNTDSGYVSVNL